VCQNLLFSTPSKNEFLLANSKGKTISSKQHRKKEETSFLLEHFISKVRLRGDLIDL